MHATGWPTDLETQICQRIQQYLKKVRNFFQKWQNSGKNNYFSVIWNGYCSFTFIFTEYSPLKLTLRLSIKISIFLKISSEICKFFGDKIYSLKNLQNFRRYFAEFLRIGPNNYRLTTDFLWNFLKKIFRFFLAGLFFTFYVSFV